MISRWQAVIISQPANVPSDAATKKKVFFEKKKDGNVTPTTINMDDDDK